MPATSFSCCHGVSCTAPLQFFDRKAIEDMVNQENKLLAQRRDLRNALKVLTSPLCMRCNTRADVETLERLCNWVVLGRSSLPSGGQGP